MTAPNVLPDPTTEAGARVVDRLERELIGWLTTVTPVGQPQASAVWFRWTGGEIVVYSRAGTPRTRNIAANPHVSFNLNSDAEGDEIVTFEADALIDPNALGAANDGVFIAKYRRLIDGYGWTPEKYQADYPAVIRIRPTRLRLG